MSSPGKDEWPEVGELAVTTVNKITRYGVYATLDEYGKEGFLHISEISTGWVRNIHDFIREGEKVVLKVLRVDVDRKHIDLSLRRVTKGERRERILLWKRSKKTESLLRSASQKLGISLEEIYAKTWVPLEEAFGEIHEGLERATKEGVDVLLKLGIPSDIANVLVEVAKEKIRIRTVKVRGHLRISCTKPDGVLRIKEALLKAKGVQVTPGASISLDVVSPPKYRIEVTASDYKEANEIMRKATETAVESITEAGGQGVFERG